MSGIPRCAKCMEYLPTFIIDFKPLSRISIPDIGSVWDPMDRETSESCPKRILISDQEDLKA